MTAFWLAFAGVTSLFFCEGMLSIRRRSIEKSIALRDAFFDSAMTLLRDPATPEPVIDLIEACANTITRPEVGRLVIRRALVDRLPEASEEDDEAESLRFMGEVHGMRLDLRRSLADAALQYAQAVSFNNRLLGGVVRRLTGVWLSNPDHRAERLMIDITPRLTARDMNAIHESPPTRAA